MFWSTAQFRVQWTTTATRTATYEDGKSNDCDDKSKDLNSTIRQITTTARIADARAIHP
jgi:hypothetical protein